MKLPPQTTWTPLQRLAHHLAFVALDGASRDHCRASERTGRASDRWEAALADPDCSPRELDDASEALAEAAGAERAAQQHHSAARHRATLVERAIAEEHGR